MLLRLAAARVRERVELHQPITRHQAAQVVVAHFHRPSHLRARLERQAKATMVAATLVSVVPHFPLVAVVALVLLVETRQQTMLLAMAARD